MKRQRWSIVIAAGAVCAFSAIRVSRAETFYVDPEFSNLTVQIFDHSTSTLISSA